MNRVAIALALATSACSSITGECRREATAVGVLVVDSLSGAKIGGGTTVILEGAGFRDSASTPVIVDRDTLEIPIGIGRSGVVALTVRKPGYAEWHEERLVVPQDGCGNALTVHVTAKLLRIGSGKEAATDNAQREQ